MPHPALSARRVLLALLVALLWGVSSPAMFADTLEQLVNKGNAAAQNQNYAAAIPLYEQAVKLAPSEKTLKNNLAVLYSNQAVTLQGQKNYPAALSHLEKAMKLVAPGSREEKSINEAKASILFSQAMDLKDAKPTLEAADYAQIKTLLEQSIALNPQERAFRKALAGLYMEEAYQLAMQERFIEAEPLLQKALTYDPESQTLKQSLANVYLGQAKYDAKNRESLLDRAISTDSSPKVRQTADLIRQQDTLTASASAGGFAGSPGNIQARPPAGIIKLSVVDMVKDMEAQLQIQPPTKATLTDRVETLEKQVLGKPQKGPMAVRAKTVYTALMGSYDGTLGDSNPQLTQAPALPSPDSYLDRIFEVTDGKVIRWAKFPVRVYFEEPKNNPSFRPEYKAAALDGFNVWKDRTNGYINFVEIQNPAAADIQVAWADAYVDRFADPEKVPDIYRTYTPPKATYLMRAVQMASMFTPGYFSLAPQAAAAALQYQQAKKIDVLREESKITLGLAPTRSMDAGSAKMLIQNMAAKEFGHALGLKGHSSNEGDLMYPALRSDIPQFPTTRDLTTLRELYNRPPNIILNVR